MLGYAGKAGKKAAEMGRFFASEWLREPGAQKMLIGKAEPFLRKGIDQLSTAIRPKKAYKTNRKDLDKWYPSQSGGLFIQTLVFRIFTAIKNSSKNFQFLKVWFIYQLRGSFRIFHQFNRHSVSHVFHGFSKYRIVHQFKQIFFKSVFRLGSQGSIFVDIVFHEIFLLKF